MACTPAQFYCKPLSDGGHAFSCLERCDGRVSEFECPATRAGVYRRLFTASERVQQFVDVPVESPVERAVQVVEVSGPPYPRRLVSGGLERVPGHGVLNEHASLRAVDLQPVRAAVSVGGIVGTEEATDCPVGEAQGEGECAVATSCLLCHLGHDGFDPAAQVLEHVEAVALGLDEVGVGMGGLGWFHAETTGGEDYLAELTLLYRFPRLLYRPSVAVVEVDGEEQAAPGRFVK